MRRSLRRVLISLALVVVYTLAFPVVARQELSITREWAVDIANTPVSTPPPSDATRIPVSLDSSFAYVGTDGSVLLRAPVPYGVALSPDAFISFAATPDQLVVQHTDGRYQATLPERGYPRFLGQSIFVFDGLDTTVAAYTPAGEFRWRRHFPGPLVSLSADGGMTVAGLMAGGVEIVDAAGNAVPIQGVSHTAGLIGYGTAITAESGYAAAVLGPETPSILVLDFRDNIYVPVLRVETRTRPGTAVTMQFARGGQSLIVDDGGMRVIDLTTGGETVVSSAYALHSIAETGRGRSPGADLVLAIGQGDSRLPEAGFTYACELVGFDAEGFVPFRQQFSGELVGIQTSGTSFYLQADDRLLRFEVQRL